MTPMQWVAAGAIVIIAAAFVVNTISEIQERQIRIKANAKMLNQAYEFNQYNMDKIRTMDMDQHFND